MHIDKDLVAASATPLVLAILDEGESYGYAILKRVVSSPTARCSGPTGCSTPCSIGWTGSAMCDGVADAARGAPAQVLRITDDGRARSPTSGGSGLPFRARSQRLAGLGRPAGRGRGA